MADHLAPNVSLDLWFTPQELKGVGGMPGTVQGCRKTLAKLAAEHPDKVRQRKKTKAKEYHFSILPEPTRMHIYQQHRRRLESDPQMKRLRQMMDPRADIPLPDRLQAIIELERLEPGSARRLRAEGRIAVVDRFEEWRATANTYGPPAIMSEIATFCRMFNAGEFKFEQAVLDAMPKRNGKPWLTVKTLHRWVNNWRKHGLKGLLGDYGNRTGGSKIDRNEPLKREILRLIHNQPHINGKRILEYLRADHPDLAIVCARSIDRWIDRWKRDNKGGWVAHANPDGWKSKLMPAFGSQHEHIERLNQLWELDSTPGDWMLKDGRHSVIGCIDMYSRRLILHVSRTSTAAAVAAVLRKAILAWGVPEAVRTDNGRDYVSKQVTTLLHALEIEQLLCIPYASEEKGTIERAFQTMSHGILEHLPGFIGHNVGERQVIEARKSFAQRLANRDEVIEVDLDSTELQRILDDWCEHYYHRARHAGIGKTPLEMVAACRQPVRRITAEQERGLDMLLTELAGGATVGKKGIRHNNLYYIHPELALWIGQRVRIRYDDTDYGRLYVYSPDLEFICLAEAPEVTGISRQEVAIAAKAKAKKHIAEARKQVRELTRDMKKNIPEIVMEHRKKEAGNVVAMPQPSEPYETKELAEATRAADAKEQADAAQRPLTMPDPEPEQPPSRASKAAVLQMYEGDMNKRHAYFLSIEARIERHEFVTRAEREALEHYRQTDDYRVCDYVFKEGGLTLDLFGF